MIIVTCTSLRTKLQFASNLLVTDIVTCRAANTAKNAKCEHIDLEFLECEHRIF